MTDPISPRGPYPCTTGNGHASPRKNLLMLSAFAAAPLVVGIVLLPAVPALSLLLFALGALLIVVVALQLVYELLTQGRGQVTALFTSDPAYGQQVGVSVDIGSKWAVAVELILTGHDGDGAVVFESTQRATIDDLEGFDAGFDLRLPQADQLTGGAHPEQDVRWTLAIVPMVRLPGLSDAVPNEVGRRTAHGIKLRLPDQR